MKKTLLLSVVASSMIMAGGDIAPVEPVVETPAPVAEASGWDFGGNAVAYYQTVDALGNGDLGSGPTTWNDVAVQLRATNKDIFAGIGAGVEVTGLYSGADAFSDRRIQNGGNGNRVGGGITQAYLTYGMGNTSIKAGRQHLPKGLSPFAFTEGWQPVKNSFDAVLVVNSDLPDTTLVGAWSNKSNSSVGDLTSFNYHDAGTPVEAEDGVFMLAAQNKSIEGLTLTGNYYFAPDMTSTLAGGGDAHAIWGDAKFKISDFSIGLQGGSIMPDGTGLDDTTAFGAKIGGNFGMFDASVAYSSVNDGTVSIHNWGTNVKTPLYTQSILNQNSIKRDADTFKVAAGMKALGGKFGLAYINADMGATALGSTFMGGTGAGTYQEIDVTYKTKVTENTTVFAAYVNQNDDRLTDDTQNFIRVWARYNFN